MEFNPTLGDVLRHARLGNTCPSCREELSNNTPVDEHTAEVACPHCGESYHLTELLQWYEAVVVPFPELDEEEDEEAGELLEVACG